MDFIDRLLKLRFAQPPVSPLTLSSARVLCSTHALQLRCDGTSRLCPSNNFATFPAKNVQPSERREHSAEVRPLRLSTFVTEITETLSVTLAQLTGGVDLPDSQAVLRH